MSADPKIWTNSCPGDLNDELPPMQLGDAGMAVDRAELAFPEWKRMGLARRCEALLECRASLTARSEEIAQIIAREVGKPLREARLEMGAVLAKFALAIDDAQAFLAERPVADGPHPASVRSLPRGVAAVIAPFNFPVHLGHGAAVAYLLAGNPVVFKPSPLAAHVGAAYGAVMREALPSGVFEVVQGWAEVSRSLCLDERVRSVCFTGSAAAGRELAQAMAGDISKALALELGGQNCSIVCEDADVVGAAEAIADSMCLTAGQRCNATSRILVARQVRGHFLDALRESLRRYVPGDPRNEQTMLGPVVSQRAFERYQALTSRAGNWVIKPWSDGVRGYFVGPALLEAERAFQLGGEEFFAPMATLEVFESFEEAVALQRLDRMGLTASVFSQHEDIFEAYAAELVVGNLYWNLPTTLSPSTLPFGGALEAGNGCPGGRGFVRYAAVEQAVQRRLPHL